MFPVNKTLRFELKPIGRTQEYIEEHGILDTDFHRAESYKRVKKIIDRYHKKFIDEALSGLVLDGLEEYMAIYLITKRDDKQEKELVNIQTSLRKQIAKQFTKHPRYKNLFKKDLIKKDLIYFTKGCEEEQDLIKEFTDFTTYFEGFHKNRVNIYSDEDKSTAISYRIIHQNLPKYIDNIKVFSMVKNSAVCEQFEGLLKDLQTRIKIDTIEEYFEISGFNKVITQQGIDVYNTILGAFSEEDKIKVKGLNEYINLYNQQTGKLKKDKIPKLKPLFKQILSDRETVSFITEQFASDKEVLDTVQECYIRLRQTILENEQQMNAGELLTDISSYQLDKIYIRNDSSITAISKYRFDDWSYLLNAISDCYDHENKGKNKNTGNYAENKKKALKKIKNYSILELNKIASDYANKEYHIEEYFQKEIVRLLNNVNRAYDTFLILYNARDDRTVSLCKNDKDIAKLKALLDSLKEVQWLIKPLIGGQEESDKDEMFYGELLRIWAELDTITPLYNKVRNYVTKKAYFLEKVKLNFDKSTLLDGWDRNKEKDNLGIIMRKNDLYYLGILNRRYNKVIEEAPEPESNKVYQKMEYKLLPGPNKMLPKVFFSQSRKEQFSPGDALKENYDKGTHKKGESFNLDNCHELIDFFKSSLEKHEEWSQFGFRFSDTKNYEDISGFYREVEHQGYKLTFRDIDEEYINSLVDHGQLYLFQIYNKDFSPYSKGTPNLHTLYWNMLFAPENLKNVVYKLNGQAEIFYRKASIKPEDIIRHKEKIPILNKNPENKKRESIFPYELVKDKRFTCDKYQFHVPITLNFQAEGENRLNHKINQLIHDAEDMHVIGIDRGERNLLYLTVIDMQGNIKKQMSLNEIISYDKNKVKHEKNYQQLLDKRERENKAARQNWQTINTIKELKEGYLSQVIHVIANLMIEYNAVVVLEDLNAGFIRGRQKVEKQVYQKFEKMLVEKLNYLVDKNKNSEENGGLLRAYQLTDKFVSFQRLGRQSGFLFYVPAWNTSKIDPTTGFVNLFYTKYESIEKTRDFIMKFDSIFYNHEQGYFEFTFHYSNFTYKAEGSRQEWTVCSIGKRIENYRNPEQNNEWDTRIVDLTQEIKDLLIRYDIPMDGGGDLRKAFIGIEKADFYKHFMKLFTLTMQMRNSDSKTGTDQLLSPVLNRQGKFFSTGTGDFLPENADANGAYNIARKGLWIIEQIKNTDIRQLDKIKLAISNKEWLKYAQEHTL
ncbi:MAG: type V CRISPR-associated protein Cas12a/Cpf1 [Bacteroidales bacterium]|nr:type V CRISPR-associated protein Cas12a/Cpf1 [Clostridium sp.]MCM1202785.1 type V CRISPR-associated protein Cas12a/Cpf1 [Bacteroidales bacterium]